MRVTLPTNTRSRNTAYISGSDTFNQRDHCWETPLRSGQLSSNWKVEGLNILVIGTKEQIFNLKTKSFSQGNISKLAEKQAYFSAAKRTRISFQINYLQARVLVILQSRLRTRIWLNILTVQKQQESQPKFFQRRTSIKSLTLKGSPP